MIKLSSFFLMSALMTTTVIGSEGHVSFFLDLNKKIVTINAPKNITGFQLKQAIQENTNIPMDQYRLFSKFTKKEVTDDETNVFRNDVNQQFYLRPKPKAHSLTDPIKVSFLGIVGDLQLELPHEAMIKDLHEELSQQPALQGQDFALAVNNVIFTNNSTPLVNYRGEQFQILTFQRKN